VIVIPASHFGDVRQHVGGGGLAAAAGGGSRLQGDRAPGRAGTCPVGSGGRRRVPGAAETVGDV